MATVMSAQPDNTLMAAALEYAKRGRPVFPCSGNKQPLTQHGFQDATTEPAQIRRWWTQWPDALIGMPTGRVSGWVVIDCDVREGLDGPEALEAKAAPYGGIPHTVMSLTPSGGIHFWYRAPEQEVRNSASRIAPGVDVRGEGGYVIVPPSRLPDGRCYEWEASNPPRPGDMPAWLLRLAGTRTQPEPVVEHVNGKVVSGQRNAYLASYAGRMARAGFDRSQVMEAVRAENARICNPPLTMHELERTIGKSADRWVARAAEDGVRPVGVPPPDEQAREQRREQAASGDIQPPLLGEFLAADYPEQEQVIGPLHVGYIGIIAAPTGLGKTQLGIAIARHAAAGTDWCHWTVPKPVRVLYVDGEMAGREMQERLTAYNDLPPGADFRIWNAISWGAEQGLGHPNFAEERWMDILIAWAASVDLIILDNVMSLVHMPGVSMSSDEFWRPMYLLGLKMRAMGKTLLIIDHANDIGRIFGTKTKEWNANVVMMLEAPKGSSSDENGPLNEGVNGAKNSVNTEAEKTGFVHGVLGGSWRTAFNVLFTKRRGGMSKQNMAFQARLARSSQGHARWSTVWIAEAEMEQAYELAKEMNQRDVAAEMGISVGKVNKLLQRARQFYAGTGRPQ